MSTLQKRTLRLVWTLTQDTRPRPFRKLYSLFTEATKVAQHTVDDALMVVSQVCLENSGQSMLLQPHLKPRTEG